MKLISCHITNFGKLSNFDYSFSDGLNIINEYNGWGKTTFADFIKAMLYSLPASRARNLKDNLRKKYKPWNNGEFGGNLIFEANGETYKIQRTFGQTESEDTFSLFNTKTNKPSNDYSSNIGYELFGLDSESFSKTTYLPQLDFKIDLTDNISAKLNNLTQDKDDVNSYNNAISLIDEKRKIYQKTGERGKYFEVKKEYDALINKKELYDELSSSVSKLEKDKKEISFKINTLKQNEETLQTKINQSIESEKFKNIDNLKNEISQLSKSKDQLYYELNEKVPSQDELNNIRKTAENLPILEEKLNNLSQKLNIEKENLNQVNSFFNNQIISPEQINKIENLYSKTKLNKTSTIEEPKSNKTKNIIIASIFSIVSIISIILFALSIINIFVLCGLIGTSIAAFALILIINSKKQKMDFTPAESDNEELNKLLSFNFEDLLTIDSKMYIFRENIKKKCKIDAEIDTLNQNISDINTEINNVNKKLSSFTSFYSDNEINIFDLIFDITKKSLKFEQLNQTINSKQAEYQSLSANLNLETRKELSDEENLDELNNRRKEIASTLSTLQKELSTISTTLERYQTKLEDLDEDLQRENELKQELDHITKKLKVFELTDKYLKQAKDELDSAFIKPIADNFAKLVSSLNAYDIENFQIDTNFNISIDHNGQSKELSFFSKGYQDIAYICTRLASIDAMFKQEKPFIILDDPFVNLDEEKLNLAKKLLQNLSKTYQIIYLICHNSRK